MKPLDSEEEIKKLKNLKKDNEKILQKWYKQIEKTQKVIFQDYCKKNYLKECEPYHCTYRIVGECKYPEKISELENLIKFK